MISAPGTVDEGECLASWEYLPERECGRLPVRAEHVAVVGHQGVIPGRRGDAGADAADTPVHHADLQGGPRGVEGVVVAGDRGDADLWQGVKAPVHPRRVL